MSVPDNTNLELIPTFCDLKFVQENGYLTPDMRLYNDQLNQYLQNNVGSSGFVAPGVTPAQITQVSTRKPDGTFWLDTVNNVIVFKINGSLFKVTMTPYP